MMYFWVVQNANYLAHKIHLKLYFWVGPKAKYFAHKINLNLYFWVTQFVYLVNMRVKST